MQPSSTSRTASKVKMVSDVGEMLITVQDHSLGAGQAR